MKSNQNISLWKLRTQSLKSIPAIFFIALVFTISSCEKEEITNEDLKEINFKNVSNYTLDNIPIIKNNQDINILMQNQEDKDEEKLNKYLYEIALATRDLIKDDNFNKTIIQMAKESGIEIAFLLDLEKIAPRYFDIINKNLKRNGLSLQSIANDMTHTPISSNPEYPETAEIEKYVPGIFIPNLDQIDSNKQPIISANTETDCTNNEQIEDFIVSWYFTNSGELKEIILGEETSLKTSNPLFLIDHAVKFKRQKITNNVLEENTPDTKQNKSVAHTKSLSYKIKTGYRYENSGKSEYWIDARRIRSDGAAWMFYSSVPGGKRLVKVPKNQINTTVYSSKIHAPQFWLPYSYNKFYWNTYERDWNRSSKSLGSATNWGTTITLEGRRRYSGDWYAWIPSTVNIHNTPFEWYGWETCVNFTSWKAEYQVCKIE
ncbi:hypothetical protein [Aquimarina muelleri]|uniref:Uncharacterized protein n=1 Tax=Aquimarina muelleri TaxID=279356 RepID=A0A918N0M2_9FLAO|nr:hypothetical protein [Aquimarina muelleri]MCX2762343.1 hypothetical protein [Aquimarina muelleri]GGX03579.1 hypothetical protein GCM10007384_01650 [Aquimarina muelleri]